MVTGVQICCGIFTLLMIVKLKVLPTSGRSACHLCRKNYPNVKITTNPDDILLSTEIDAVVIATPVHTHFELAKKALENGKHVLIEKPFTSSSAQAVELMNIAEKKRIACNG